MTASPLCFPPDYSAAEDGTGDPGVIKTHGTEGILVIAVKKPALMAAAACHRWAHVHQRTDARSLEGISPDGAEVELTCPRINLEPVHRELLATHRDILLQPSQTRCPEDIAGLQEVLSKFNYDLVRGGRG